MKTLKTVRIKVVLFFAVVTVATAAGFGRKYVLADGIPSPKPLYYSGTLTEGGKLVNDTRVITINLWADRTTQGAPLCTTMHSNRRPLPMPADFAHKTRSVSFSSALLTERSR